LEKIRVAAVAGDQLRCYCPFHNDDNPSLSINVVLNKAYCFAGCFSGTFTGLCVRLNGCYPKSPKDVLQFDKNANGNVFNLHTISYDWQQKDNENLHKRGFTDETIRKWKIYYNSFELAIPVEDEHGEIVGFVYRTLANQEPKYMHPGLDKKNMLFNLHNVTGSTVSITEGPLDCIWMYQCGFKDVVSTLGTVSDEQIELLTRFSQVDCYMDNDEAGAKATRRIGYALTRKKIPVRVAVLPEGIKDVQELPKNKLLKITLEPFYLFINRRNSGRTLANITEVNNARRRN